MYDGTLTFRIYGHVRACVESWKNIEIPESASLKEKMEAIFLEKVALRLAHLALMPVAFVCTVIDLTAGVIHGGSQVATQGFYEEPNLKLRVGSYIVSSLFESTLYAINPSAKIDPPYIRGFFSQALFKARTHKLFDLRNDDSFWVKHIVARLLVTSLLPVMAAALTLDFMISIIALPVALITGGHFKPLNDLVFRGLSVTVLFKEIVDWGAHMVKPDIPSTEEQNFMMGGW